LGEIPEHWEVDRLKWSVESCKNGIWGSEADGELDLVVLRVADFGRNSFSINDEDLTVRAIEQKDRDGRLLNKGDL
jgi:type I restriction enzyme S subunit